LLVLCYLCSGEKGRKIRRRKKRACCYLRGMRKWVGAAVGVVGEEGRGGSYL
jgi:hypothetical protein